MAIESYVVINREWENKNDKFIYGKPEVCSCWLFWREKYDPRNHQWGNWHELIIPCDVFEYERVDELLKTIDDPYCCWLAFKCGAVTPVEHFTLTEESMLNALNSFKLQASFENLKGFVKIRHYYEKTIVEPHFEDIL